MGTKTRKSLLPRAVYSTHVLKFFLTFIAHLIAYYIFASFQATAMSAYNTFGNFSAIREGNSQNKIALIRHSDVLYDHVRNVRTKTSGRSRYHGLAHLANVRKVSARGQNWTSNPAWRCGYSLYRTSALTVWCNGHYVRWSRDSSVNTVTTPRNRKSIADRGKKFSILYVSRLVPRST
jgi:hypothetical protein